MLPMHNAMCDYRLESAMLAHSHLFYIVTIPYKLWVTIVALLSPQHTIQDPQVELKFRPEP